MSSFGSSATNQSQALTSLLVPTRITDLVRNEYLALLGTLGVLVGLTLATTIRTRVDRPAASLAHALRNVSMTSRQRAREPAHRAENPPTRPENASTNVTRRGPDPGPERTQSAFARESNLTGRLRRREQPDLQALFLAEARKRVHRVPTAPRRWRDKKRGSGPAPDARRTARWLRTSRTRPGR
jgi:hypothetical protein